MIGHMPLIRIRLARKRPKAVWVYLGKDPLDQAALWDKFEDSLGHAHIVIEDTDKIPFLDLRFAAGMQVHIDGEDYNRLLQAHVAFLKAGASEVFTLANNELIYDRGEDYAPH